jgi:hypothetical protein
MLSNDFVGRENYLRCDAGAGNQITDTNNNIEIGNFGTAGDSGVIRLGCQSACGAVRS